MNPSRLPRTDTGTLAPAAAAPRRKKPEDTPAGCRALAAADLDRADATGGDQASRRYRNSAAMWLARAESLDRTEAEFQAQLRRARTLRIIGEVE